MTELPVDGRDLDADGFFRLRAAELAVGWAPGRYGHVVQAPESPLPPRRALDAALLTAVTSERCFVAFSGGRDSSAVLAAATSLARQHGLADPVPVTRVYPEHRDPEEERAQELVVRHLALRDWVRIEVTDQQDLLGPLGAQALRRYGVLFPSALHSLSLLHAVARDGDLVTGEGGDEVLGGHRINSIVIALTGRHLLSRRVVSALAYNSAPRRVRRRVVRRSLLADLPYVHVPAVSSTVDVMAAELADEPLHWGHAKRSLLVRRPVALGLHNMRKLADEAAVRLHHPLLDPGFVHALAHAGATRGFAGRATVLRWLFEEELPDELIGRTGKMTFNDVVVGPATREFIRSWDGSGVDPTFVDVDALLRTCRQEFVGASALPLLQAAWLHVETNDNSEAVVTGSRR